MKDYHTRFQVYCKDENRDRFIRRLKNAGCEVWIWKNTERLTVEAKPSIESFLRLKYNDFGTHTFMLFRYPDPRQNSLAVKV